VPLDFSNQPHLSQFAKRPTYAEQISWCGVFPKYGKFIFEVVVLAPRLRFNVKHSDCD